MKKQLILFYDQHISGHHLAYIHHLIVYSRRDSQRDVVFAIRQEAIDVFAKDAPKCVRFIAAPLVTTGSVAKNSAEEGKWLTRVIQQEKITDLFFLNFNPYQQIVCTGSFYKLNCRLHGILFSPPHRLTPSPDRPIREKISQFLRRNRKYLQLRWAMRNPHLTNLLILDDEEGAHQLNRLGTTNFMMLSDPIEQATLAESGKLAYELLPGSKLLLAFGSIGPRKNLGNIIRSLQDCGDEKITLLIVGKGKPDYVAGLEVLARAYDDNDSVRVIIENRFVNDDEMETLFAAADGIVMVYLNFYGSSGVLGRAAKYATPVLVANEGLIFALTQRYRLGVAVAGDPISIGKGIEQLFAESLSDGYGGAEYLASKTPEKFSETIFSMLETPDEI